MDVQFKQLAVHRSLYGIDNSENTQSFTHSNSIPASLSQTLATIQHLGYVQIDSISVVERAHHHVLWNRVDDYQKNDLEILLESSQIFEYWFHAASYIPLRDYRFALRQMNSIRKGGNKYFNRGDAALMREILARAKSEGEIKSRDLLMQVRSSSGTWWKSNVVKNSFEQLYMQGELMVCRRVGAEKIYTLAEDFLPASLDLTEPSIEEYALYLYETVKRSQGIFTWKQLTHLKAGLDLKKAMQMIVQQQMDAQKLLEIRSHSGAYLYVDAEALNQMPKTHHRVKILSPFDNLVIHRDRLMALFNFDYRLECYVKPEKRQYGYFSLPILYSVELVAIIDCKAHRQQEVLEIINFHVQASIHHWSDFIELLSIELVRFAKFNGCKLDPSFLQKLKK